MNKGGIGFMHLGCGKISTGIELISYTSEEEGVPVKMTKQVYTKEMAESGTPTAGMLCRVVNCGDNVGVGEVLFISPQYVIIDFNGREQHYHASSVELLPIPEPTERDRAIDNINEIISSNVHLNNRDAAGDLYDAGYRKVMNQSQAVSKIQIALSDRLPETQALAYARKIYKALYGDTND